MAHIKLWWRQRSALVIYYYFSSYKFKYKCKDMQMLGSGFTKLTVMRHGNKLHADINFITFYFITIYYLKVLDG